MKLITKEIERQLLASPLYSKDGKPPIEVPIIVKFFHPFSNWTWYVTEGEKQPDGDWRFFGLIRGHENELGYFLLSELAGLRIRGLGIERDMHFGNHTLAEAQEKRI